MEHNEVDITHTVKTSEAAGRRLIKNVDTGDTRWLSQVSVACDDEEHDLEPVKPAKPPTKAELKKLEQQLKALNKTYQD